MGGADNIWEPVGRSLPDARQAPTGVAAGELGNRSGGGSGGRGRDVGARGEGYRYRTKRVEDGGGGQEPTKGEMVVELVHITFRDGVL